MLSDGQKIMETRVEPLAAPGSMAIGIK